MPVVNCPDCREPVNIDTDWYGRRIECQDCGRRFTPRDPNLREDDDRPPPRRRRLRSMYDDAPPKNNNAALWITLSVVGAVVVIPVLVCIGFVFWASTAKQQFNSTWADHRAGPSSEVTAAFPVPPSSHFLTAVGATGGEQLWYSSINDPNSTLDVDLVAGYLDYPPGTPDPLATEYPTIRQAVEDDFCANAFGLGLPIERRTTAYGYPAMEATYDRESGGYTLRVVHLNDRPPGSNVRVAVVLAGGMHLKPEDKQKFLNSVRIGKQ